MAYYPGVDRSVTGTNAGPYTGGPAIWKRLTAKSFWNGSCLIYTGSPSTKYGRTSIGKNRPNLYVHRIIWELINGPIPLGFDICHICDVPRCFYPPHLFLGTRSDNMRDCQRKGRWNEGSRGSKGEKNGRAILTMEQVKEIRILKDSGDTYKNLGLIFGVSESNIEHIVKRKLWA